MTLDPSIATAERSDMARRLIAQAQTEAVDLVVLSALELCVLGGPGHPLFDEPVAQAWGYLGQGRRRKVMGEVTDGLVERGLLLGDGAPSAKRDGGVTHALKPELGLVLAARTRPSSIVVADAVLPDLRAPRFFALGDQSEPVRAVVVEEPTTLPEDAAGRFPHIRKLGPLGWLYRYTLLSRERTAEILAELTISPPERDGMVIAPAWTVAAFYPGSGNRDGERMTVHGDGAVARLDGPGVGTSVVYEAAGLRAVMFQLMGGWRR